MLVHCQILNICMHLFSLICISVFSYQCQCFFLSLSMFSLIGVSVFSYQCQCFLLLMSVFSVINVSDFSYHCQCFLLSVSVFSLINGGVFSYTCLTAVCMFSLISVSPLGPTPRSARSDDNPPSVENEEIVEEIEEELLRSNASSVRFHFLSYYSQCIYSFD